MLISPEQLADRGCWISGDQVYAFASSAAQGISEIGFHGPQPPSINSRVFVEPAGVLRCFERKRDGAVVPIPLSSLEWYAGGAAVRRAGTDEEPVAFETSARLFIIRFAGTVNEAIVRMKKASLFTRIHGVRDWTIAPSDGRCLDLSFRDTILLDAWMRRGGPYGGDFLIPEQVRRRIFQTARRSGLATPDNLRPEYRGSPLPLYDASVRIRIGGSAFRLEEEEDAWVFSALPDRRSEHLLVLAFSSGAAARPGEDLPSLEGIPSAREKYAAIFASAPSLRVGEHPEIERFFGTLPPLVESSIIRAHGVPRATPGRYYWIWAWDAMVTAIAGLRWGDLRTAEATARFVDGHRDEGGEIPMRWTHDLLPLDSQPRGALETLLLLLADGIAAEGGDQQILRQIYHRAVEHLRRCAAIADGRGFFPNIGFYPDLPLRFGRSERSAVAMECGAFYVFCRTCESVAIRFGDHEVADHSRRLASAHEDSFLEAFWDRERGFLRDALDLDTGAPNPSTPIFSLLMLQSAAGITLLRPVLEECGEFLSKHLLTPAGFRTLPQSDPHADSETVSGTWYPHWDQYALKILRRCGRRGEILRWAGAVEEALKILGSCPEHLPIDPLLAGNPAAWREHGSTSNLNCATGWHAALLEGLVGWEVDRGGVTIIPLSLPVDPLSVRGIVSRGTTFDVDVTNQGPVLDSISLDGHPLHGTLKLPAHLYDRKRHRVEIRYGAGPEKPRLLELINGEVLEGMGTKRGKAIAELRVRTFGRGEALLATPAGETVSLNGEPVLHSGSGERVLVPIESAGEHLLAISPA